MNNKKTFNFITVLVCFLIFTSIIVYSTIPRGYIVTMLGAGNMEENANLNSMGFIVTTKDNSVIVIDGGREEDKDYVVERILEYGNKVDYWFITHPHDDHMGVLKQVLEDKDLDLSIENLVYSFNNVAWYVTQEPDRADFVVSAFNSLNSNKIKNKIEAQINQVITIDNLECKILKVADPNLIEDKNTVNDSSMVFKITSKDTKKSMMFLGDVYIGGSKELLDTQKDELECFAVQMSHHGQDGATKELYKAINPKECFFNSPKWLYNNDAGTGYNSGTWKSLEVQNWVKELNAKSFIAYNGDISIQF